jgi:peptidoglycan/xylan/chitin deacetylase (PgdA/CDA1 family)
VRRFASLVLCYHGVSETWDSILSIGPAVMERQLRWLLRRRYRPVTLEAALAGERGQLHVTFDDAYRNVRSALPVLRRLGVSATVFACPGYAVDGRPLDVPELAEEAAAKPDEMATMTWDDLRELADDGVEIGSHTVTHPHLPRLGDAELDRELSESRARLSDELSRPCRFLAYPYGDDDPRVHAAARRAGYTAAFSLSAPRRGADPFDLPRVDLYRPDGMLRTTLKTSFLGDPLRALRGSRGQRRYRG